MPFGTEKLEWCGYPTVKKILMLRLLVLTEFTNVTDTQTLHDDIGRACIASRGKNEQIIMFTPSISFITSVYHVNIANVCVTLLLYQFSEIYPLVSNTGGNYRKLSSAWVMQYLPWVQIIKISPVRD